MGISSKKNVKFEQELDSQVVKVVYEISFFGGIFHFTNKTFCFLKIKKAAPQCYTA